MSKPAQGLPFAATRKALAGALAEIDGLLLGSVVVRLMRCGKQNCACKGDPPALHGPYAQWTHTVHGKTVTKLLTGQGRYPGLDARAETPQDPDIAPARPRIPSHQSTISPPASPLEHQHPACGPAQRLPSVPSGEPHPNEIGP